MKIKLLRLTAPFICLFYLIPQNIYSQESTNLNSTNIIDTLYSLNQKNLIFIKQITFRSKENFEGNNLDTLNIDSKEIEKWFLWIEVTYFYLLTHNEIVNIKKKIYTKEKEYDMNTNYMIIKKPVLEKK